ncbi:MAG TPA: DUF1565 domain-containing protein [Kofleriaceae bacterium]|nr:DUF1565 domain-containing protein [Kofleriaceae bacterium]
MNTRLAAILLAAATLAACNPGGSVTDDATPVDPPPDAAPPSIDGQVLEVDAAPAIDAQEPDGPAARTWPRTAAELRAALGDRGVWTSAWQLDETEGRAVDELGMSALMSMGSVAYQQPGAWADDRAVGFDSSDDGLVAALPPFELVRDRSVAALFSIRLGDAGAGTTIAARRGNDGGVILLAVDPSTGHLSAELGDGVHTALVELPIDHRDGAFHDVLVVVDRQAQVLRIVSDLGRSPATSIATIGDAVTTAPFALGATRGNGAADVQIAFAAVATDDVGALTTGADDALRALRTATERKAPIVRPPAGLPWTPPWPIRRDHRGAFSIDVDPHDLRLVTTAHLWISPAGSDAADGSASTPMRSLHAALSAMTGPTTIHVAPGTYGADAGWYGVNPPYDVNIIAEGGRARLTTADVDLAWVPSAAGAGVYQATAAAAPYTVVDSGIAGSEPWLLHVATAADVAATPGSWTADGALVTVHTRDGRVPDAWVEALPAATLNGYIDDPARSVYLEGLDLEGGYKALHVNHAHELILVDTAFRYGAGEGLSVLDTDEVYAFHAVAEANNADGLAYSWVDHILEVDCAGTDNGRDNSDIDNGSTVHTGGTVVRVGGVYRSNGGPNVADVQGSSTWNLGTVAGANHAITQTQRVNFYTDGVLWLREGNALDAPVDHTIDLVPAGGGTMHLYDSDRATFGGDGVIDERAE